MGRSPARRPARDRFVSRVVGAMNKGAAKGAGGGSVRLGADVPLTIPGVISTRCPTLDAATRRGGVPLSKLTILTGDPSTGKTTLALQMAAEVQAADGAAIFMDAERKMDLEYARALGVNTDDLIVSYPHHLQECFATLKGALEVVREANAGGDGKPIPVLVVLDSINAAISSWDYEAEYDDVPRPGSQASAMSWILPKLIMDVGFTPIALVFVSQTRELIGSYKARKTIAGGKAPEYYSSLVIDLSRRRQVKDGGEEGGKAVGQQIEATVIKNSIGVPFGKAGFLIRWGYGVDYNDALLRQAEAEGLLNVGAGGWYDFPMDGEPKPVRWQGARGFERVIEKRPEVLTALEKGLKFGRGK